VRSANADVSACDALEDQATLRAIAAALVAGTMLRARRCDSGLLSLQRAAHVAKVVSDAAPLRTKRLMCSIVPPGLASARTSSGTT
jgi:hypothetical protein